MRGLYALYGVFSHFHGKSAAAFDGYALHSADSFRWKFK